MIARPRGSAAVPDLREAQNGDGGDPHLLSRLRGLVHPAECWVGDTLTGQLCSHHRRRLRKIGWESALDAPPGGWAEAGTAPRGGNLVEVLVDGAQALPAMAEEMRSARSHIHLTGWFFSPEFALERDAEIVILRDLLAELAERVDVRMLVWAGAPLPLFRPSRVAVRRMRERLTAHSRIQCELDPHERPLHCHHEKTIVIDDRVAFVGGIDLTVDDGDRFDTNEHPARAAVGWHDVSVRIEGPAVADVAEHFRMRWHEVRGERLAAPAVPEPKPDGVEVQVVRTVPEHIYKAVPRGEFGILESYFRALRGAQRFIYLENQFLWSPEVAEILIEKLSSPPTPDFRLLALLPAHPNAGADNTRGLLVRLIEADAGAGRLLACTLYARAGMHADPVYVHAKVGIVDDAWLTVGSANLNEHSLFNDTEMNVVIRDPALAENTRLRLWSEHLELPIDQIRRDPVEVIDDLWKPIAEAQLAGREADLPLTHRLVRLPGLSTRKYRLLGPLSGMVVDT